jgi:hypothetical protein
MRPDSTSAPTTVSIDSTLTPAATPVNLTELEFVADGASAPLGLCQGNMNV